MRWLAILLPAGFLVITASLSHLVFPRLMWPFPAAIAVLALELVAVFFFAVFIFARIERAEDDAVHQAREQLALAEANAALLRQTRRQAVEAAALYALGRDIAASASTSRVLESIARQAVQLLRVDAARLCLLDDDKRRLRLGALASAPALPCGATTAEDFAAERVDAVLLSAGPVDLSRRRGFCPLLEPRFTRTHWAAPVRADGELLGAICVGSSSARTWDADDAALLDNLANLAAIAVKKEQLQRQVATLAILEERDRIAMDLHDGIIQNIYGIGLSLEKAVEQIPADPAAAGTRIERTIGDLNAVIQDVRDYIFELEQSQVGVADVGAALEWLAQEFRESAALDVDLDVSPAVAAAVAPSAVPHLLQVAREALANVVRHSGDAHAGLRLGSTRDGQVELVVRDRGRGFEAVVDRPRDARAGHGLTNIAARARLLGGRLHVKSAPAEGTEVRVVLPVSARPVVAAQAGDA